MSQAFGLLSSLPFFDEVPVAWNAPVSRLTEVKEGAKVRRMLSDRSQDHFIPMGLTAAFHQFLLPGEIRSEIEWARTNQWHTGWSDIGLRTLPFILLPDAGLLPPATIAGYSLAQPARISGIPGLALFDSAGRFLPAVDSQSVEASSPQGRSRNLSKAVRRAGRLHEGRKTTAVTAVRAILTEDDDVGRLAGLLAALDEFCCKGRAAMVALPETGEWPEATGPVVPLAEAAASVVPTLAAAAEQRRRRASNVSRRRTLEIVARGSSESAAARSPEPREFGASMMGDVSLSGPAADALFSGGKFRGMGISNHTDAPQMTSVLAPPDGQTIGGRLEPTTAFSFESPEARGMRIVEQLAPPGTSERRVNGSRFVSDYSFVQERPLLISTHALSIADGEYPRGAELLHLSFPVTGNLTIRTPAEKSGGEPVERVMDPGGQSNEIYGSRFELAIGGQTLTIAFLTREALPLITSIGIHLIPEPVVTIGGRFRHSTVGSQPAGLEFAVVWGSGEDGREEVDRLLAGRVPIAVRRELLNGPTITGGSPARSADRLRRAKPGQ